MTDAAVKPPSAVRVPGIDGFRGLAVLMMAVGNFGLGVDWVPAWLKHAPDIGFTVADLVAPMFIVSSALTIGSSIRRRRDIQGKASAIAWLVNRSLALIGIGAIISAGQALLLPVPGVDTSWGVLQCIGASTLLLGMVIFQRPLVRAAVALATLAGYQWLLDTFWLDTILHSGHNGLPGSISWAALMTLSTAVADVWRARPGARRRVWLLFLLGCLSAGSALILATWFPVSKNRASATYMLLSLGLCLVVFAVFDALFSAWPMALLWLQRIGRNPLLLYLAHLVLLAPFALAAADGWYAGAPPWLTLVEAAVIGAVIIVLAAVLDRKGWVVRL